jgi:hypothetical protein
MFAALAIVLLAAAGAVSAAIGEPSKEVQVQRVISAPRATVWRTLTDLPSYGRWNPLFVRASGRLHAGATIHLRVAESNSAVADRSVKVLTVRQLHKIRWEDRVLLRGLRDREFTLRLDPLGRRTLVSVTERLEGPLEPLMGGLTPRRALAGMLAALARTTVRGS